MSTTTCALCGRQYAGNSRPLWVFDLSGRLAGTAHTSCIDTTHPRRHRYLRGFTAADGPQMQAQLYVWVMDLRPRSPFSSDLGMAETLLLCMPEDGSDALTDDQECMLARWRLGKTQLSPEREQRIRALYRGLVAEFHAWRAGLNAEDGS